MDPNGSKKYQKLKTSNLPKSRRLPAFLTTEKEGFEHCPVLANPLGKEVWRDPMCLVTQVVTQRFLKNITRYVNPRSNYYSAIPSQIYKAFHEKMGLG